jgi:hypothetical protein
MTLARCTRHPAPGTRHPAPGREDNVAEPLTLINVFEVPDGEADQFIAAWERTRDYLAAQPGYVETALHQAVSPGTEFSSS